MGEWVPVKNQLPDVNPENGYIFHMEKMSGYFRTLIACYKIGDRLEVAPLSFYIDWNNVPHWTVCNNVFHDWTFPVLCWMELPIPPAEKEEKPE